MFKRKFKKKFGSKFNLSNFDIKLMLIEKEEISKAGT